MTYWATAEGISDHEGPFDTEEEAQAAAALLSTPPNTTIRRRATVYQIDNPGESK